MAPKALIVDDEPNIRFALAELLRREGMDPTESPDGLDAVAKVQAEEYDVVLLDLRMPRLDGMAALRKMREARPELIVVILTAHGSQQTAMDAITAGAYDHFTKPFDVNEVRVVVRRAVEKAGLLRELRRAREEKASSRYSYGGIVGQSSAMREVYRVLQRVAGSDVTVLITGESGTGKEVVASAVHYNSPRAAKAFIKVNTVAIPEALLESELFGHERGAFTGAVAQKIGKVEAANGGTLFLDEIGDMPPGLQAKLLRVLQEREIERVGGTKTIPVDIRVICATNRDLSQAVKDGTFREDLYYRINVLPLVLPPLRSRREDIPLLIDHFIQVYNPRLGKEIRGVSPEALDRFLAYPWPGNVRELENMLQRTMLMAQSRVIEEEDLPPVIQAATHPSRSAVPVGATVLGTGAQGPAAGGVLAGIDLGELLDFASCKTPLADRLAQVTDLLEREMIVRALAKCDSKRQETADLLGISRKSLHNKMVRYSLFEGTRDGEDG